MLVFPFVIMYIEYKGTKYDMNFGLRGCLKFPIEVIYVSCIISCAIR